jgi:hypothetical protein
MQRLEVSSAVRPIYGSLGVKRLGVTANREGEAGTEFLALNMMVHKRPKEGEVKNGECSAVQ